MSKSKDYHFKESKDVFVSSSKKVVSVVW